MKILFCILCLATQIASAHTIWYDFNSTTSAAVVDGKSASMKDENNLDVNGIFISTSLTTYRNGVNSGNVDWTTTNPQNAYSSDVITSNSGFDIGDSWQTFLAAPNQTTSLTITISGLQAGAQYDFFAVVGTPFENAGVWNSPSFGEDNTHNGIYEGSVELTSQSLQVRDPNNIAVKGVTADKNGQISFTINSNGKHTTSINSLVLKQIPEPSSATLGILGLGSLLLRRRRTN